MAHRSSLRNLAVRAAGFLTRIALWIPYALFLLLPRQDAVTLMSRLFSEPSLDFRLLIERLHADHPSTRVVVLAHRDSGRIRTAANLIVQSYWLARSRAVITDSYMIPISLLPHPSTVTVVQSWHALGAIKKFGYASLDTPEGHSSAMATAMRMHRNYDWLLVGGAAMIPEFAAAFDQDPATIVPIGLPRVDYLRDEVAAAETRARIRRDHPEIGERPVVLYAPTFRKGTTVPVRTVIDAVDLDAYALVVKLHPLDQIDDEVPGVVMRSSISSTEWMFAADVVVSDYSAIMFDASVREVPVVVFAYDIDDYAVNRGLFVSDPELFPGPIVRDADGLARAIDRPDRQAVRRFRDRYLDRVDGTATEAIIALALAGHP